MTVTPNQFHNPRHGIHSRWRAAAILALLGGVIAASVELPRYLAGPKAIADDGDEAAAARESLKAAADLSKGFQLVAKAIRPSVVNIKSVHKMNAPFGMDGGGLDPFGNGSPFDDFFDRLIPPGSDPRGQQAPRGQQDDPRRGRRRDRELKREGLGTGVIVTEDGTILTNNHVVEGADELTVKLWDGRSFPAKVIGTDKRTDVAVVKIDAKGLVPASFGDSDKIEVGEWAVAVGSPFGLEQTVTSGIVSAKGRDEVGVASIEDFIQTDAAINPGNSGGPLLNLKGEMIGINTAIASRSGGNMGIGFAIPINMARSIMDSIVKDGRVVRGFLGVEIQNLDQAEEGLRDGLAYKGSHGVLVRSVGRDSAAEKAGLKPGDIITSFNGKPMQDAGRLRNTVAATAPGTKAELEIWRDGAMKKVEATVGDAPANVEVARGEAGEAESFDLGVTVETLTPEKADRLGLKGFTGAVVTEVERGSRAEQIELKAGDVIFKVGGKEVRTAEEFRDAIKSADLKAGVTLWIAGEKGQRFAFLRD